MSDDLPRRHKAPEAPAPLSGYRQTRRGSKAVKSAKKAERQHRIATMLDRAGRKTRNVVYVTVYGLAVLGMGLLLMLLVATAVNTVARWSARRAVEQATSVEKTSREREDVLVIGVDNDQAVGFLALRVDSRGGQVFGIAIPDGAFIDVPGQGFERIGEAYRAGPDVALSAVSNFLGVPFSNYVVVPKAVYTDAIRRQSVSAIPDASQTSNLNSKDMGTLKQTLAKIAQKNVALVPMPVKPIKLGDQTYFEPQREEIADLLKSWWGVDASAEQNIVRVIVYNGAGTPGIAGEAAQQLIRAGLRVVDTKNADNFKYATTRIVVRRGDAARGQLVKEALGAGDVTVEPSTSDVTDVIVIIGKDYRPPTDEGTRAK